MRTVPPSSALAWRAGAMAAHLRVTIGGVDLSALEGRDWVHRARVSESVDDDVATCEIELTKQDGELSLSPLLGGSKLNAGGTVIALAKTITIETAVIAQGVAPQAADWLVRFEGQVATFDFAGPTVMITGQDKGGLLIRNMIEVQRVYGSDVGVDVEEVMQEILDDNDTGVTLFSANGTGGTPFDPGDSPGFAIRPYKQSKVNVLQALQELAVMIGWRVTYRWNADTEAFELTFYEPDRAKTAADWAFDEGTEYREVRSLGLDDADIRNAFRGVYSDISGVEMTGNPNLTFANANPDTITRAAGSFITDGFAQGHRIKVTKQGSANNGEFTLASVSATVLTLIDDDALTAEGAANGYTVTTGLRTAVDDEDAASIAAYGRRYMEITEASTSQINTLAEIKALLAAAKSDLAEPTAMAEVTVHLLPWAELGDLWSFAPNGEHFDTLQKLAPQVLEHSWDPSGDATTTATLRGKVSGGRRHWLEREGGRGAAANIDLFSDDAAQSPAAEAHVASIIVTFDDPRAMEPPISDWLFTEVHVSTTASFPPTPATLKASGRNTRFEVGGLVPGTTYYAKCIHYDAQGNKAAISAQVSVATQQVGPYHENPEAERGPVNPNPNLSIFTKDETLFPPDGWSVNAGAWGTADGNFYFDDGQHLSADRSIKRVEYTSPDGTAKTLLSDWFPIEAGVPYMVQYTIRRDTTNLGGGDLVRFRLGYQLDDEARDASPAPTGFRGLVIDFAAGTHSQASWTANVWITDAGFVVPGSTDRYMRLFITLADDAADPQPNIWVDSYRVCRVPERLTFPASKTSSDDRSIAANTWVRPRLHDTNGFFEGLLNQYDTAGGFVDGANGGGGTDHEYTVIVGGTYSVIGKVQLDDLDAGDAVVAKVQRNGSDLQIGVPHVCQGTSFAPAAAVVYWEGRLAPGDTIDLWAKHNDATGRNIDDSECILYIQQIPERRE